MDTTNPPVVYLVDDDEQVRIAVSSLLRSSGLHVEAFASSSEFLSFQKPPRPSCLILDVRLRGESGFTLQQDADKWGVHMPILFITGHGDIEMSVRAMKAGAQEFFTKPFRDQDMLDAVTQALARDAARLAAEQSTAEIRACYDSLTPREREVLIYVVSGLMNKEIAAEMHLSEIMVKIHRGKLMKKMHSRSIPDLVRKAETLGVSVKPVR
jgi:FixJ family two-component response regulator